MGASRGRSWNDGSSTSPEAEPPERAVGIAIREAGAAAVLGGIACAAASLRGLDASPEALRARSGSALFESPAAAAPAWAPLVAEVAAEPGRLGELYAQSLSREERKRRGVFYTPAWVADLALDHPEAALHPRDPVLDPACGGGRFLLAAYRRLAAHLPPDAALARLAGFDLDPLAIATARAALYLAAASPRAPEPPVSRVVQAANLLDLHGTPAAPAGYGAVIGNPPYRGGRHAPVTGPDPGATSRFVAAEYQVDPYVLFLEAGLATLRPGGRLALVVPDTFMSNLRTPALRRLLAERHCVVGVVGLPGGTFGAGVSTVVLRVTSGGRTPVRVPFLAAAPDQVPRRTATVLVDAGDRGAPWARVPIDGARLPAARDADAPTLGDLGEVARGINPYHHSTHTADEIARRVHHADHQAGPDFTPELRGRDLQPFRVAWSGRHWIRYGPWLKEPRHPRLFEGPRLLVRKILGPTLVVAYTDAPFHTDQSVYIVRLRADQPWPPLALLALVGSRALADRLRALHQVHGDLFPQLKVAELRSAPLPRVSPTAPAVQALAELMAAHLARGAPEAERAPLDAAAAALYAAAGAD